MGLKNVPKSVTFIDWLDEAFRRVLISLVFLLKMRPYFARIFTKMSPYEELGTLDKLTRLL